MVMSIFNHSYTVEHWMSFDHFIMSHVYSIHVYISEWMNNSVIFQLVFFSFNCPTLFQGRIKAIKTWLNSFIVLRRWSHVSLWICPQSSLERFYSMCTFIYWVQIINIHTLNEVDHKFMSSSIGILCIS